MPLLGLAVLLLAFWAVSYTTIVNWLGELQFAYLGEYFPLLTAMVLFVLIALPLVAGLLLIGRRRRASQAPAAVDPVVDQRRAMIRLRRTGAHFRRFFGWLALFLAGGVAVTGLAITQLPDAVGPQMVIGSPQAVIGEGSARITAGSTGRVARLDEDFFLARRRTYVAPVLYGDWQQPVRLMTTVLRDGNRFTPVTSGILVRQGMPRELIELYRQVGVEIEDTPYLLMRDESQVGWRPWMVLWQFIILGVLATLGWLVLRRQDKRLKLLLDSPELAPRDELT